MINFIEKFDPERIGVANHAKATPDKAALVMGDIRVSYGQLHTSTNQLANSLLRIGIKPGDRIALMMHNSPEILRAWTAAGKIAATPIAMNYRFKADELAYIVNDSESRALIYGHDLAKVVAEAKPRLQVPDVRFVCSGDPPLPGDLNLENLLETGAVTPPEVQPATHAVASSLAYTSGTTGRPKGVVRSSKNRLNTLLGYAHTFESTYDDIHLAAGPLYHAAPFGWAAYSLILGNTVVIMPRFDAEDFLRLIETHRATTTFVVPTMLNRIVNLPKKIRNAHDISSMRVITVAAEAFPFPLKKSVVDFFGEEKLFEFYGGTEISVVTYLRPEDQLRKPGSCGKPAMDSHIKLLDENKQEVPVGEVGILYIKSPFLLDEYYRNPEATQANYHDGYFTVGDMARADEEGYYYIVDRAVDMIISGGVNIYPAEIEETLYRHPAVYDVAVIGVPDPEWGERIVAYVVCKEGARATQEEITEHVAAHLASYKKPREVVFVEDLPYSPSGKLLKRVLREAHMGGAS
jgi:fatty-acyl-CoA synthase/long-chain acyl-CoA synthetase